ncbi:FtsW/RodA/SpoVE family cell cycle protein [Marinilactibacillus piezotolerans]|uniref:FtsW/RodA/SpoVE family cell cycle protein n=1 Tax=Marinilactibacillus piezotolerans TaxID=258723 RepID=UPI0009B06C76|nr:FtsW/RodA/SpoVE family cell cycle protein [Marinilactibacillus piezotolerans]
MVKERIKHADKYLAIPYLILSLFSVVMVYSASSYVALQDFDDPQYYLIRQSIFVTIGMILAFLGFLFPFRVLKKKRLVMLVTIGTAFTLLVLLFFGREINGAKGWIETPLFNIQPAEFAKLVVIWYLSYMLSKRQKVITNEFLNSILAPGLLVGFIVALIFIQPDTGAAIVISAVSCVLLMASGVSAKFGLKISAIGAAVVSGILLLVRTYGEHLPFLPHYQYQRFLAFWDPFALAEGAGLQLVQSYYALSRGGLFGVGIGNSVQKTGYLPEPYTDFILSITGEELGLFGILLVLILSTLIISRMYLIGIRSKKSFESMMCIGIATLFLIQAAINVGGVVGLMPISGMTFPLLSYGGSSMLILSAAVGLVLNISARDNIERSRKK